MRYQERDARPRYDPDPTWRAHAACRGIDPEIMFPSNGTGVVWAKQVCTNCPVVAACLEYALANHEEHGIWGSTSERERRNLMRRRREVA